MNYIDFGDQWKEDINFTKGYMDGVASVMYAAAKLGTSAWYITKGFMEETHERFQRNPHYHYASILGPYCVACRCNLPGPNGEWE